MLFLYLGLISDSFKAITREMKRNDVDFDFQFRVRKFLEHQINGDFEREKEEIIFNKLSNTIKDEFLYQVYGKKLTKIPFFHTNLSQNCIMALSKIIEKIDLAPGELLTKVLLKHE